MPRPRNRDAIYQQLLERIKSGAWDEGFIPTQKELQKEFGVAIQSIKLSLTRLAAEGYIIQRGRNTAVRRKISKVPALMPDFSSYMRAQGEDPRIENIRDNEVIALSEQDAENFGLPSGMMSFRRTRVQGIMDGDIFEPYRITETAYPLYLAEPFQAEAKRDPGFVLINAIRDRYNLVIATSSMTTGARLPTEDEQKWLKISEWTPVLDIYRTSHAGNGKTPIMFTHATWVSFRVRLTMDDVPTALK